MRTVIEEGYLHTECKPLIVLVYDLYKKDLISYDEAMRQATNKDDLALRISGVTSGSASLSRLDLQEKSTAQ